MISWEKKLDLCEQWLVIKCTQATVLVKSSLVKRVGILLRGAGRALFCVCKIRGPG